MNRTAIANALRRIANELREEGLHGAATEVEQAAAEVMQDPENLMDLVKQLKAEGVSSITVGEHGGQKAPTGFTIDEAISHMDPSDKLTPVQGDGRGGWIAIIGGRTIQIRKPHGHGAKHHKPESNEKHPRQHQEEKSHPREHRVDPETNPRQESPAESEMHEQTATASVRVENPRGYRA
jgi:hypothetical protein